MTNDAASTQSTGVLDAGERLRRLLSVLAYLAHVGEATLDDLARRFSMSTSTLVSELELAACCGLPPYTPDQLLELIVDDERVIAYNLDALRRPPRLTPDEGFAVAAAARALLAVGDQDAHAPLRRALDKLESTLGDVGVSIDLERPPHFEVLRAAAIAGELVEIDYLGARRGGETTRTVDAYAVVAREGHFYLDGFCHLAGDWRRFQLERIVAVRPTGRKGEARTPPPELTGTRAFSGGGATRVAMVRLPKERNILIERFAAGPGEDHEDGFVLVPVSVGDADFLGRLLLRLGASAEVVEPTELGGARREVATRALRRYGIG